MKSRFSSHAFFRSDIGIPKLCLFFKIRTCP